MLIIDHDMDLVFRFAERITVLVSGAVFATGTPREIGGQSRRARRVPRARRPWLRRSSSRHVSAGYGETVVLEDVNLALAQGGESISVIGRNGVGKTTLLATVMGHTTLHAGEVMLGGARLLGVPIFRRAVLGIGFVPQEREIFPSLTVRENLAVGGAAGPVDAGARVRAVPEPGRAALATWASQLSGGEQQMLSIARALLTNPSVLLMDEPTEGLAPVIVEALTAVLARARGRARALDRPGRAEQPRGARLLAAHGGHGQGSRRLRRPLGRPRAPIPNVSPSSSAWSSLSAPHYYE